MGPDALVIGLAKKVKRKPKDEEEGGDEPDTEGDDEGMSLDEVEGSAVSDLVEAIDGNGDNREGRIKDALRDFVRACIKREEGGEYGEGE